MSGSRRHTRRGITEGKVARLERTPLAEPCPDCGKRRYLTRKAAKAAMRRLSAGDPYVSVYRCGEYFHFGHQPYSVRRGFEDRNAWRAAR